MSVEQNDIDEFIELFVPNNKERAKLNLQFLIREARIDELESAIVHIKTEAQTPMQYLERSLAQLKSNLEAK